MTNTKKEIIESFENKKRDFRNWYYKSEELLSSSYTLNSTNYRHKRTGLFLMGLSLETAIKGYIYKKSIESQNLYKHELEKLLVDCGINEQLSELEKELILKLTENVIWLGKYPSPTDRRKNNFAENFNTTGKCYVFSDNDFDLCCSILQKLGIVVIINENQILKFRF